MYLEKVNNEPAQNVALAFDIGMTVPEYLFLERVPEKDYLKLLMTNEWDIYGTLALKKINGAKITINLWWDGEKFKNHLIIIKDRFLLSGYQSIKLKDNLLTMFPLQKIERFINPELKKLKDIILKKSPEYKGFVEIDAVVTVEHIFYQKIMFGSSHDAYFCMTNLYNAMDENFIVTLQEGLELEPVKDFVSSLRLYGYPYEPKRNLAIADKAIEIGVLKQDKTAINTININKCPECYTVTGSGQSVSQSWKNIYRSIEGIEKYGLCYRIDGGDVARKSYAELKTWSYI